MFEIYDGAGKRKKVYLKLEGKLEYFDCPINLVVVDEYGKISDNGIVLGITEGGKLRRYSGLRTDLGFLLTADSKISLD
jgi:hypothetical protein